MSSSPGEASPGLEIRRSSRDHELLRRRLATWIVDRLPVGAEVEVGPLQGSTATGMSSDTLIFDVTCVVDGEQSTESLVARLAPDDRDVPVFQRYDLTTQFETIQLVGTLSGTPVPHARWNEPDPGAIGAPFFVMDRVEGVVPPDFMPYNFGDSWLATADAENQRVLADSTVDIVAHLHAIPDPEARFARLAAAAPGPRLADHVRRVDAWYRWAVSAGGMRSTLIEACLARLEDIEMTFGAAPVLCWGDARIGNVIYRDFRPVAVLDWEMATIGPRELDVSWLVFAHLVFESIAHGLDLAGMADFLRPDDVVARYEATSGAVLGDLEPFFTLAAIQFGIVFLRTGARQIHFGEIAPPEDPDTLLHHGELVRRFLSTGTWV